jgi:hypothetical protein
MAKATAWSSSCGGTGANGKIGMPEDISATERMLRDWQDRATEKAERFGRMQEQVEQISVTADNVRGAAEHYQSVDDDNRDVLGGVR